MAKWLQSKGHDASSIFDECRGISDDEVIQKAFNEQRILITNDKDFGELAFKSKVPHYGIILLRLENEQSQTKIESIEKLLALYPDKLQNAFIVLTADQVRFGKL